MRTEFHHEFYNDPEPEEAGTIVITATIFGDDDDNLALMTTPLPIKDFVGDENDDCVCQSKEELTDFLANAEIDQDFILDALTNLDVYVDDVTCSTSSSEYSPGCVLKVWLDLIFDNLDDGDDDVDGDEDEYDEEEEDEEADEVDEEDDEEEEDEEADEVDEEDDEEDDEEEDEEDEDDDDSLSQFEDITSNTLSRPASKLVVKSLRRKIYNKKIEKEKSNNNEECTICLEEFSNGAILVPLPCGHDFDDECIVKWFKTSHVCPLCRFELPREDQITRVLDRLAQLIFTGLRI